MTILRFLTSVSTSVGSIPKKGLVGNPGLGGLSSGPGRGEMVIPPVSGEQNKVEFQPPRCLALSRDVSPVCQ